MLEDADHDTIDGAEEAVRAGTALGLTVLRGVELGAAEDRHMHILGLHLGPECPALTALCRKLRASRDERKFRIVDFLREKGMDVSLEEEKGLDGLECFYPRHTPGQTAAYLRLAEKYGLYITAGSDFHGEAVRPDTRLTPISLELGWLI